jgi:hypothetical protein
MTNEPARLEIESFRKGDESKWQARHIPYRLVQTFKTNRVPMAMYNATRTWIERNPAYDYFFFDDVMVLDYVTNGFTCQNFNFSKDELVRAFRSIRPGAGKADLFRYLIIYEQGGIYMDIDTICFHALDDFIEGEDHVVTGIGMRCDFHQWGLIYSKHHPFLKRTIENSVSNILNRTFIKRFENSLEGLCGPACLDASIKQVLGIPLESRFRPGIFLQILEGRPHRIKILNSDFFGGNVGFKYSEYLSDLAKMGVRYWWEDRLFNDTP